MKRPNSSAHFASGARRAGAPSSFQNLKGVLEKEKKEKKKKEKEMKRLKKELEEVKKEKRVSEERRDYLERRLDWEVENRQDLVNAAVARRMEQLGLAATPW